MKAKELGQHLGQGTITQRGTTGAFETIYVRYGCNPHSSFKDLLWKRSV